MFGECHAHLIMDGKNYREAVNLHKEEVNVDVVRRHLQAYQENGITFVRDGGDAYGVSQKAKELAGEYGIDYRSPIFAIHRKGHYGRIVGRAFEDMKEYRERINEVRALGGDFIKIMISGIMDYSACGLLSEEPLEPGEIKEMVHIAHEEGFAVMIHGNGSRPVLAAAEAGADSIEHGNYIDRACMEAMAANGCVWVPTIVTTGNLLGCGRYEEEVLQQIFRTECENLWLGYECGVQLALGSDAGAYLVPHGTAVAQEYEIFRQALPDVGERSLCCHLVRGEEIIREKFQV